MNLLNRVNLNDWQKHRIMVKYLVNKSQIQSVIFNKFYVYAK